MPRCHHPTILQLEAPARGYKPGNCLGAFGQANEDKERRQYCLRVVRRAKLCAVRNAKCLADLDLIGCGSATTLVKTSLVRLSDHILALKHTFLGDAP
jgi:hypothetical protein